MLSPASPSKSSCCIVRPYSNLSCPSLDRRTSTPGQVACRAVRFMCVHTPAESMVYDRADIHGDAAHVACLRVYVCTTYVAGSVDSMRVNWLSSMSRLPPRNQRHVDDRQSLHCLRALDCAAARATC